MRLPVKIGIAVAVVAVLGFVFMRTITGTRAEPYTVGADTLRGWTVAVEAASDPSDPLLVLHPPPDLVRGLFNQVFKRAMESMNAPTSPGIPLLMRDEFDRAFAGRVTPAALLAAAREAGLETTPLVPLCLAHRRVSEVSSTRQLYFAIFDAPAFARFRRRSQALLRDGPAPRADFDPEQLSPALFIALSESTVSQWLPFRADARADCVAPIVTAVDRQR